MNLRPTNCQKANTNVPMHFKSDHSIQNYEIYDNLIGLLCCRSKH